MIAFKKPGELLLFVEQKLPPRIKEELFYETIKRVYKGKPYEQRVRRNGIYALDHLRGLGFIIGVTDNPETFLYPEKYILCWTKLKKHLEQYDSLTFEQDMHRLVSINTACKYFEVTRPTIYKLINEKKIPFVEVLSQKRIQLKDLLDYIDNNKKFK